LTWLNHQTWDSMHMGCYVEYVATSRAKLVPTRVWRVK
jgi:hypothetical protein